MWGVCPIYFEPEGEIACSVKSRYPSARTIEGSLVGIVDKRCSSNITHFTWEMYGVEN